jgi:nucleoid-associated protein YgaU
MHLTLTTPAHNPGIVDVVTTQNGQTAALTNAFTYTAPTTTFTVTRWNKPGSSLWSIVKIEYGNPNLWPTIYNANRTRIDNPDLIYPGQVLVIPS